MTEGPDPWGDDEPASEDDDQGEPTPEDHSATKPAEPEDPFTTETIAFMHGDLLSVLSRGGPVGSHFVPTGVAGGFLFRFDQLVRAIGARLSS